MKTADNINRREFLNYAWLGAMALLMAQTSGVGVLFTFPRFAEGEFGGTFILGKAAEVLPPPGGAPVPYNQGKFWLVNTEAGVLAIYKVCTHLGCLYNWRELNGRFECPCHGSQFAQDGTYLRGPAPRSLDRFVIKTVDQARNTLAQTDSEGNPLSVSPEATLVVDTSQRIMGKQAVRTG